MLTERLSVSSVQVYPDGNAIIVVAKAGANSKTEVFRLSPGQLQRLARIAGVTSQALPQIAAGSTLTVKGEHVVKGQVITNTRTGEMVTMTKDHFRVEELTIEPTPQARVMAMVAAMGVQALFTAVAAPAPAAKAAEAAEAAKAAEAAGSEQTAAEIVAGEDSPF